MSRNFTRLALTASVMALAAAAHGASIWTGSTDNDWATGTNWNPTGVPNIAGGDSATISSGSVVYTAGGDWTISTGTVTFNGGSFTQAGGGAWMRVGEAGAGTLQIDTGSTFSMGTAGNMLVGNNGGNGTINVAGGTFAATTIGITTGSLNVSNGGTVTYGDHFAVNTGTTVSLTGNGSLLDVGAHEFKPHNGGIVNISGGILKANLISFDGGDAVVNFAGGEIVLALGTSWDGGIYGGSATKYINYNGAASGIMHLVGDTTGSFANNLLTIGDVKWNDVTDPTKFSVTTDVTGSFIQAVPEPGFLAMAGLSSLLILRRRRA